MTITLERARKAGRAMTVALLIGASAFGGLYTSQNRWVRAGMCLLTIGVTGGLVAYWVTNGGNGSQ